MKKNEQKGFIESLGQNSKTKIAAIAGALAFIGAGCSLNTEQSEFGSVVETRLEQSFNNAGKFSTEGLETRTLQFPDEVTVDAAIKKGVKALDDQGDIDLDFVTKKELAQIECATVLINELASEDELSTIRETYIHGEELQQVAQDKPGSGEEQFTQNNEQYQKVGSMCSKLILKSLGNGKRLIIPIGISKE